jgi:hypothetical protein
VLVLLAFLGALAVAGMAWLAAGGISARAAPGRTETALARHMRAMAIPRAARDRRAPAAQTPESLRSGCQLAASPSTVPVPHAGMPVKRTPFSMM